ncbi:MAG: ABC transporter permease subunit [Candidatus Dormibacteria bacterium]
MLGRARAAVLGRRELLVLVALVVAAYIVPPAFLHVRAVPIEAFGLGFTQAAPLALQAIGVLLVFRSNRVLNFSQVALGGVSAVIFYQFLLHRSVIWAYDQLCACIGPNLVAAPYWLQVLNFAIALVLALVLAPLLAALTYLLVVRRFDSAPPLLLTVVTIGVSFLLSTLAVTLGGIFPVGTFNLQLPLDVVVSIGNARFHLPDVMALGGLFIAAIAIGAIFRFSDLGVVMRASADNPARARTLGVNVTSMKTVVWTLAGALSGLAGIVAGASGNPAVGLSAPGLVRILTVVVIARLTSIPMVLVGALGLGVIEQELGFSFNSTAVFDGVLLVMVTGFLLIRSREQGRSDLDPSGGAFPSAGEVRPIPLELSRFWLVRRYLVGGAVALGVLVAGFPFVATPAQVSLVTVALIYSMVGLSVLVLTGWAGQISLGQFAFAAVGAYVTGILAQVHGVPMLLAIPAGGVAGMALAALVGIPALRLPGLNLAVVTLALGLATASILLNPQYLGSYLPAVVDRPGLLGLDLNDERVFFYLTLGVLVLSMVGVLGIRQSRTGRALIAARDNEVAAQQLGVNLFQLRLKAFAISGFIAAVAGGLFAFQQHGVPAASYTADVSLSQFLVTIIGGVGSIWGPVLGNLYATVITVVNQPFLASIGLGGGVVVLLILAPRGIGGLVFALRDALLRRVAIRYRIKSPSLVADGGALRPRGKLARLVRRGGGSVFVPPAYQLDAQWGVDAVLREREDRRS